MKYLPGRDSKLILGTIALLLLLTPLASFAGTQTITYTYYPSGAIWKATYVDRASIEYIYDNSGNRLLKAVTLLYPDIAAIPSSLGFGNIRVGTVSSSQSVTITNNGTATLTIGSVSLAGADAAQFAKEADTCSLAAVSPAGTCQISLTFTPASGGSKNALISIPSNDPDTPDLNIPINGNGAFLLAIGRTGTASGAVTGPGIDCGGDCTEVFSSGAAVTLTASTAGQSCSTFSGWTGGGCTGTGPCTLTMTSDKMVTATFNTTVPTAGFTAVPLSGKMPLTVNFTDTSSCAASWLWDFGDGATSTLQNPRHTYNQPIPAGQFSRLYNATLTASNTSGSNSLSQVITAKCPNDPVRNTRTGQQFTSLQAAYNAAADGDVLQVQAVMFTENLAANLAKGVTFDGGYGCDYNPTAIGDSVIKGDVTITNGSVAMGRFRIEQ